jgi:hypothetical protein
VGAMSRKCVPNSANNLRAAPVIGADIHALGPASGVQHELGLCDHSAQLSFRGLDRGLPHHGCPPR